MCHLYAYSSGDSSSLSSSDSVAAFFGGAVFLGRPLPSLFPLGTYGVFFFDPFGGRPRPLFAGTSPFVALATSVFGGEARLF